MIDYEALAQDAMRGLVRTVLMRTQKEGGLPGDHHFYISFDTQAAGVTLSKRLKEKYPSEMTIVLQHRFWDLAVNEERFEVKLTFDGIPERLVIPFKAIKVFFDPSVRYGLQFEEPEGVEAAPSDSGAEPQAGEPSRPAVARKPKAPRRPRVEKDGASALTPVPSAGVGGDEAAAPAQLRPSGTPRAVPTGAASAQGEAQSGAGVRTDEDVKTDDKSDAPGSAQIVSLDAFRKK